MNYLKKLLAISVSAVMLFGCSSKSSKNDTTNNTDTTANDSQTGEQTADQRTLPVLSIETVSKDPDVMNFVNTPVSRHVAESIASWTPGYKIPPEPYYEDCTVTLTDSSGKVLLSPSEAQVKVRGNWTTTYAKKPLKIKFTEKQNMLGLNNGAEQKNWLLLAEYKDASMLRNKAALYASREIMKDDGLV